MKQSILIVDDEPNIVMTLEYTFKKLDFEVFIARDGSEAIQLLNVKAPSVVLLDVMMPNIDGYQTLEYIKSTNHLSHTKVIFLSAKNRESDIEKGLRMGANKYITKPFSIKKVVAEIQELLDDSGK